MRDCRTEAACLRIIHTSMTSPPHVVLLGAAWHEMQATVALGFWGTYRRSPPILMKHSLTTAYQDNHCNVLFCRMDILNQHVECADISTHKLWYTCSLLLF
ncbi:hypothetical protein PVAP13_4KG378003 [Panicum virgatum]|uniref:Uncharacterized protein n=1 Tax=Panicum virgatum TaxID=38727 RepID=A0A8T0TQC5_PANVG|nr:hypothetical protein PVAP13_4KG378003 [Panicum virgatum]